MECPKCHEKLSAVATVSDEQRLAVALTFQGPYIAAATVGGVLTNTAELLVNIAKEAAGAKMTVMIETIKYEEGEFRIGLLLLALHSPERTSGEP